VHRHHGDARDAATPLEEKPARMADVAVRLVQLTKRFGGDTTGRRVAKYVDDADPNQGFLAVDHIDLDVNEGEFFSLLGP
jgi:ABC-type multidrug transport system ATPase subunit